MKKIKLFLIVLSLVTFSNFAFAIEKNLNTKKNEFSLEIEQILESKAEIEVEKIDFNEIKLKLKERNILFTDRDNSSYFVIYKENKISSILYENFVSQLKYGLFLIFKDILKAGETIDYSKLKINLPEYCLFEDYDFESNEPYFSLANGFITFKEKDNTKKPELNIEYEKIE